MKIILLLSDYYSFEKNKNFRLIDKNFGMGVNKFRKTYFEEPSYGRDPCLGPSWPWWGGGGYPPIFVALE